MAKPILFAAVVLYLLSASSVRAVISTYYWDPGQTVSTSGGGSGTWNNSNAYWYYSGASSDTATPVDPPLNWNVFPSPFFYYTAYFGGTAGTVTADMSGQLEVDVSTVINTPGYTITGNMYLFDVGGITVNGPGSADTTISTVRQGGYGGYTNNSAGSLIINSWIISRGPTIYEGRVRFTNPNNIFVVDEFINIENGGTLEVGGANGVLGNPGTIIVKVRDGGAIEAYGASRTVANTLQLFNNSTIGGSNNLTFSGDVMHGTSGANKVNVTSSAPTSFSGANWAIGANTLELHATGGDVTIANAITGSNTAGNTLAKSGAGKVILTGTNTYSGDTAINAGTLVVNGGGLTGGGTVSVNSTGTLAGTGSILGAVVVNSGGTLSPGNSPGNQTYGNLSLHAGGNYNWQIGDATGAAGTGYDTITVGSDLDLTGLSIGNKYAINLWSLSSTGPDVNGNAANFDGASGYSWTLVDAGGAIITTGLTGPLADYFIVNVGAANGTGGFSNGLGGGSFSVSISGNDLLLNYSPIPEPKTTTLFLFAGVGLWMVIRRSRR